MYTNGMKFNESQLAYNDMCQAYAAILLKIAAGNDNIREDVEIFQAASDRMKEVAL